MDKGGGVMNVKLLVDCNSATRGKVYRYFRDGRLEKLITVDGYVAFDSDAYVQIKNRKTGRKVTGGKLSGKE